MCRYNWLPDLVLFEEYGNNWDEYLRILYEWYAEDFINSKPIFRNRSLGVKRLPLARNKEATFWHIIQEGDSETEKIPDFRRCERIRWPKPIIEHCEETNSGIKVWENERHKNGIQRNILIWFEQKEYLVVLRKRTGYNLFWTGYPVVKERTKQNLERDYQDYKNKQASP